MRFLAIVFSLILFSGGNVLAEKVHRFDNGLTFIYKKVPNVKIVTVQVWMKTGSVNENEKNNGISHFLEHLVFKGTKDLKPGEVDSLVESSGGSMNAATSKDYTFYYVTIPTYNAEKAFHVISQMVFHAQFISDEIEKEKPVVVQEIKRKLDGPTHEMWDYLSQRLFEGSPYERQVIGTEDNVNSFTREMLVDYYNHFYHPQNMTLVVAGDIDEAEAGKLAEKYFSYKRKVKAGKKFSKDIEVTLKKNEEKIFKKEVAQEYGAVVFPAKNLKDADKYSIEVLTEIISGGEFSVLSKEIKNHLKLVHAVDAGFLGMKHAGAYVLSYSSDPEKADKARDEMIKLMKNLKNLIDEKSLEKAKNRLKSQMVFQREKASSEANDIGYSYTLELPEYYHDFLENIDKVTLDMVVAAADNIFNKNYLHVRTVPKGND